VRDRLRHLFGLLSRTLGWVIAGLWFLCRALLIGWAALAIHYSNMPWAWLRFALAIIFAAFAIWALWLSRPRRTVAFTVLFLGVVAWWIAIPPSHDREWRIVWRIGAWKLEIVKRTSRIASACAA
jgi:hypothetical protein